jgi:hypothetical protein
MFATQTFTGAIGMSGDASPNAIVYRPEMSQNAP